MPPPSQQPVKIGPVNVEEFSHNLARLIEEGGRALAAYIKPREDGSGNKELAEEVNEVVKTLGQVTQYWLADPQRTLELQANLGKAYLELWASAAKRLSGEAAVPVVAPAANDRRFADEEWSSNQFFDFLKQAYLLGTRWANQMVSDAELDPHTKQKAEFYVRQIGNALSPSNFVLTNPELLRETLTSNAENLVRGMHMLADDVEAGGGDLRIRQSDSSMFAVGRNLAVTPGKVIFQNEIMQLLQYAPTTPTVLKKPLLIIPPWINKFYVLDLTPEKSFIKWCVDQGITVFCISWVNPDAHLAKKSWEDYVREGPLAALAAIKDATGEDQVHAIGYCVGGTMMAVALAAMAAKQDRRIVSATFFAAQVDFTYAGDLKVFVDEEQIELLEGRMAERGYLEGKSMVTVFNLLRSNDLIWPYIVNNYLRGKAPFPFDLLYWNSDATRLPAANHSYYLRNCYLDNRLTKGEATVGGTKIDLKTIKIPVYNLATREDHIAPASSVLLGSTFFGGPGEICDGRLRPYRRRHQPAGQAQISILDRPEADRRRSRGVALKATEHKGSWWPDWLAWLKDQDSTEAPARVPGDGKLKTIEDAPGSYVKMQA